jgi:hypothetical protein
MTAAVSCPRCGCPPVIEEDAAGLNARAFIVWCRACETGPRAVLCAHGLTVERAVELWNDRITKAVQS